MEDANTSLMLTQEILNPTDPANGSTLPLELPLMQNAEVDSVKQALEVAKKGDDLLCMTRKIQAYLW